MWRWKLSTETDIRRCCHPVIRDCCSNLLSEHFYLPAWSSIGVKWCLLHTDTWLYIFTESRRLKACWNLAWKAVQYCACTQEMVHVALRMDAFFHPVKIILYTENWDKILRTNQKMHVIECVSSTYFNKRKTIVWLVLIFGRFEK